MGQGGGKDQCNDPRIQEAIENHPNPRTGQGDTRVKEVTGRTSHCANMETGASGSNRTIAGMDSSNTGAGRRSQNTVCTDSAGMCRTNQRRSSSANSRYYQGENCTGTDKSSRIAGEVPDDHQGD
jgi:hypothetical protein